MLRNFECSNTVDIHFNITLLTWVTFIYEQSRCLLSVIYSIESISILALLTNRHVLVYESCGKVIELRVLEC